MYIIVITNKKGGAKNAFGDQCHQHDCDHHITSHQTHILMMKAPKTVCQKVLRKYIENVSRLLSFFYIRRPIWRQCWARFSWYVCVYTFHSIYNNPVTNGCCSFPLREGEQFHHSIQFKSFFYLLLLLFLIAYHYLLYMKR